MFWAIAPGTNHLLGAQAQDLSDSIIRSFSPEAKGNIKGEFYGDNGQGEYSIIFPMCCGSNLLFPSPCSYNLIANQPPLPHSWS